MSFSEYPKSAVGSRSFEAARWNDCKKDQPRFIGLERDLDFGWIFHRQDAAGERIPPLGIFPGMTEIRQHSQGSIAAVRQKIQVPAAQLAVNKPDFRSLW